jgi:hypothetical protein
MSGSAASSKRNDDGNQRDEVQAHLAPTVIRRRRPSASQRPWDPEGAGVAAG